jgi:hypothetical protein
VGGGYRALGVESDFIQGKYPFEVSVAIKQSFRVPMPNLSRGATFLYGYAAHVRYSSAATDFPEDPSAFGAGLLAGFSTDQTASNWYLGYAFDASFPIQVQDPGSYTNIALALLEADKGVPATEGIPTVLANTLLFKWQDGTVARTLYLGLNSLINVRYTSLPGSFSSLLLGFENGWKVPERNVVVSLGGMINYYRAKFKAQGSVGIWYYF